MHGAETKTLTIGIQGAFVFLKHVHPLVVGVRPTLLRCVAHDGSLTNWGEIENEVITSLLTALIRAVLCDKGMTYLPAAALASTEVALA